MNANLDQVLLATAQDTFASLAFLFPSEMDDGGEQADGPKVLKADFCGPVNGTLWLALDAALLPALAANMMGVGEGESLSEQEQADAAGELLNVICGNLLPQLTNPQDVYDICRPCAVAWEQFRRESAMRPPQVKVRVPLEGGRAELFLSVAPAAA